MINEQNAWLIIKALPVPTLIIKTDSPHFSIAACSESYLELTNASDKEIIGTGFFELLLSQPDNIGQDGISELKQAFEKACTTKTTQKTAIDSSTGQRAGNVFNRLTFEITPVVNNDGLVQFLICKPESQDMSEAPNAKSTKSEQLVSVEGFMEVVRSLNGIVWECRADTFEFTYVSTHTEKILGYTASEWYKNRLFWQEHIHPDDREKAVIFCAGQVREEKNHEFEYRMVGAAGQIVWIRDMVTIVKEDGQPLKLRGFMMDITELKMAAAAREFERRHKEALINNTEDLIWSVDKDLNLLAANDAFIKNIKDHTAYEIKVGGNLMAEEYFSKGYLVYWGNFYRRALNGESFITEAHSPESKEKDQLWYEISFNPIWDGETVSGIVCFSRNITESKLAKEALYLSNERYRYVTMATFDAIWDWDLRNDIIYWGEGFETIFGHKLKELKLNKESWTNHIHPDDSERVYKGIRKVIDSTQNNWQDEYRYRKADNNYAIVEDRGIVIRDKDGKAVRIIGAMQDRTQQKNEDNRLRLLESVITYSTDAIIITEAEPINQPGPAIVFVNKAFSRMTGYEVNEVIGKSPRILQGPDTDHKELNRLRASMGNWETCEIEVINYKKNGEEFWISFAVVPVADASGRFTHWISIARDVTERRRYTEKLEQQNKILKDIAWMQSHIVRAPLSRLMGLISILEPDSPNKEEQKELFGYILTSACELDEVLTSIIDTAGKLDELS